MAAKRPAGAPRLVNTGLAAAAVALLCCAGLPAIGAALGGVTLVAELGAGVGLLILAAPLLLAVAVARERRRRASGRRR